MVVQRMQQAAARCLIQCQQLANGQGGFFVRETDGLKGLFHRDLPERRKQRKGGLNNYNLLFSLGLGNGQIVGSKFRFAGGTFYDFTQRL
ncbi:hypothetical protein GCM10011375_15990 [Hymenobacter qilianensis]|uniref:Uncharacterized protein n=1 Tax=Hymenobacter qilianensis TaxID=1385715 RepID=A0ACB5PQJ3_9BACT|nr:hypothetical protein GCM10011375_15990 [Hymenobacter qilianensis]